ncbi:hypothetical protein GCM10022419_078270 [Nonomuraea rosea]|uniref:Uncharacterized protein n=1 Tax=Nonomuraea rosea TaxID=638574 RepID=A0ABP6YL88_9ACTN
MLGIAGLGAGGLKGVGWAVPRVNHAGEAARGTASRQAREPLRGGQVLKV